ncbi:MAG: prenyltransferase/squalene oxidase repeat-containing protein [Bacteroidales bacterium]|nr:prenyltransferase/squalene oxidase repeat-containing protein [Bacteroidales bacterium]
MNEELKSQVKIALNQVEQKILSLRNEKGYWDGHLSSSALAVAVAVFGLWKYDPASNKELINRGLHWLKDNINLDGGYGDTIKSKSNLSTSLLCWSALSIVKDEESFMPALNLLEHWLRQKVGELNPEKISTAILNHYADDKTFSVPILAMCALSGRLGKNGWVHVPQLPFQLAALPDRFFKWFNLSVVSYAIPALISMGLVKQKMDPPKNPLILLINKWITPKVLKVLSEKQPKNGGFLEAIPLTGFVLMTMVGADFKQHTVCSNAEKFLQNSIRNDGSWPIDTSLATWVTTLAVNAFSNETFSNLDTKQLVNGLYTQQHKNVHPFTKTHPGGWAWIHLEGGVPDGDDTSGALLALQRLAGVTEESISSATMGIQWLLGIQNNDGGFPTFCKGWGKLPFDASCPDITAHVIRAFLCWTDEVDKNMVHKIDKSIKKAVSFLQRTQNNDGSWFPLWFGNEHDKQHQNPVYGTSQVLLGLCELREKDITNADKMIEQGADFLLSVQNENGGWGGSKDTPVSIEETSLTIRALILCGKLDETTEGINFLIQKISNNDLEASPIGLYFASLWYYEEMYPLVYACAALKEFSGELSIN